jgi:SnoaL-like domain
VTRPSPPGPDPAELVELLDKQAVHEVVLRYCRGIDRMDSELVRGCYHPDATDTHGSFDGTVDEFVTWAFRLLERYEATVHLVANHLSTIVGDVAIAETYGVARHRSADPDPRRNLSVGFRYLDRLERRDGGPWLIARRIATTEWVTPPPEGPRWPIPDTDVRGRRGPDDPLYDLLAELPPH